MPTTTGTFGSMSSARRYAQAAAKPSLPAVLRRGDQSLLTVMAASRRAFNAALATPCPAHAALVGEPCWSVTADAPERSSRGLCGARVRFALGRRTR
jgi:hypothetical protein